MVQRTLDGYVFPLRPREDLSNKTSFLHLPSDIRRRIYGYAGLTLSDHDERNENGERTVIWLNYHALVDVYCPQTHQDMDIEDIPADHQLSPYHLGISRFLEGPLPHPGSYLNWGCFCQKYNFPGSTGARLHYNPTARNHCYCNLCFESAYSGSNAGCCNCKPEPSALLYVSRAISDEVSSLFFSENCFSIVRSNIGGLSGLMNIKPDVIKRMLSISIRLNICDCPDDMNCDLEEPHSLPCHPSCKETGHEKPLGGAELKKGSQLIKEWKRLCKLLATSTQPNHLNLCIICDVSDIDAANEIVTPLLELPTLRGCAIRLGMGDQENEELRNLAATTGFRLLGRPAKHSKGRFRFMDLPQEIKLQILAYTDLVTPYDLVWVPGEAYNPKGVAKLFELHSLSGSMNLRNIGIRTRQSYLRCCGKCSDALEACCCSTAHAAFSTSCICWRSPALLSTCRLIRDLALTVLYSKNNFVISPSITDSQDYLYQIPSLVRSHIQSITWVAPPVLNHRYPHRMTEPAKRSWMDFLQFCRHELNLSRLRLDIDMSQYSRFHPAVEDFEGAMYSELEEMTAVCKEMQGYMKLSPGWKDVFFHTTHAMRYGFNNMRDNTNRDYEELEGQLERGIMGESYDSFRRGKIDRRHRWNGYSCGCDLCLDLWDPVQGHNVKLTPAALARLRQEKILVEQDNPTFTSPSSSFPVFEEIE